MIEIRYLPVTWVDMRSTLKVGPEVVEVPRRRTGKD